MAYFNSNMNKRSLTIFVVGLVVTIGMIAHQMIIFRNFDPYALESITEFVHRDLSFRHRFGDTIVSNVFQIDQNSNDSISLWTLEVLGTKDTAHVIFRLRETKYGGWEVKSWRDQSIDGE
jgi:hypothetical protein